MRIKTQKPSLGIRATGKAYAPVETPTDAPTPISEIPLSRNEEKILAKLDERGEFIILTSEDRAAANKLKKRALVRMVKMTLTDLVYVFKV